MTATNIAASIQLDAYKHKLTVSLDSMAWIVEKMKNKAKQAKKTHMQAILSFLPVGVKMAAAPM